MTLEIDGTLARFVAKRSKTLRFGDEAEYLRSLIQQDMARASRPRLEDIVRPLHAHSEAQGYTDEQLAEEFELAREEVAKARRL